MVRSCASQTVTFAETNQKLRRNDQANDLKEHVCLFTRVKGPMVSWNRQEVDPDPSGWKNQVGRTRWEERPPRRTSQE